MPRPATPASPTDRLNRLAAKATRKPTTKDDDWVLQLDDSFEAEVAEYIPLGVLSKDTTALCAPRKSDITSKLLDIWCHRLWETREKKTQPDNPRIMVKKRNEQGQRTGLDDMSFLFEVKYRADGMTKKLPEPEQLPEGVTVNDKLFEMLISPEVGLTDKNARALINPIEGDIQILNVVELAAPFNTMLNSDQPVLKSAADKMMSYFEAKVAKPSEKVVKLAPMTDEESSACLRSVQRAFLKEGFFGRACGYCRSEEEVNKLIRFVNPTLSVGSLQFAISDSKRDRAERLEKVLHEFLAVTEE